MIEITKLRRLLKTRFGGVLLVGKHEENGKACAMELLSAYRGVEWTDEPGDSWDLRGLNDIHVPNAIRTKHILPVLAVYGDARKWPMKRQRQVAEKLVILTVQRIIAELPKLPDDIRTKCLNVDSLRSAVSAASRAGTEQMSLKYAADYALFAAKSDSPSSVALFITDAIFWAVNRRCSREKMFITACKLWLGAAK